MLLLKTWIIVILCCGNYSRVEIFNGGNTVQDYEYKQFWDFQVLARFMVTLNLGLPIFSFLFILTDKTPSLNICLGKGYLNFFSTKAQFCSEDNPYKNCLCWAWLTILSIGNSKFQINVLTSIKAIQKYYKELRHPQFFRSIHFNFRFLLF